MQKLSLFNCLFLINEKEITENFEKSLVALESIIVLWQCGNNKYQLFVLNKKNTK